MSEEIVRAFTTKQRKVGGNYTDVLIISDSLRNASIVQKVTNSPKLDGWYQVSQEDSKTGKKIERYPILENRKETGTWEDLRLDYLKVTGTDSYSKQETGKLFLLVKRTLTKWLVKMALSPFGRIHKMIKTSFEKKQKTGVTTSC